MNEKQREQIDKIARQINHRIDITQQSLPENERCSDAQSNNRKIKLQPIIKNSNKGRKMWDLAISEEIQRSKQSWQSDTSGKEPMINPLIKAGQTVSQTARSMDYTNVLFMKREFDYMQEIIQGSVQETSPEVIVEETAAFPAISLPGQSSGVYVAVPELIDQYTKSRGSGREIYEIVEEIKYKGNLRTYNGKLYAFNYAEGRFDGLDNEQIYHIVDRYAKKKIMEIGSSSVYSDIVKLLKYDSTIAVGDEMQLPGHIWAFRGCLVNICTGETMINDGRYFILSNLNCVFDQYSDCPEFEKFVCSVSGGDSNLIELIWQMIGYILSNDMGAKCFFTFIGPKDTGKTLLAKVIAEFFPKKLISGLDISDFGQQFALSELLGKRINLCLDLTDEIIPVRSVGKIKSITGGDLVRGEQKFKQGVLFENYAKLIFASNHPLRTGKNDDAFFERQVIVPFSHPVPKEKQDTHLYERLISELPGIAVRAIDAYKRLVGNHYVFPESQKRLPDNLVYDDEKIIEEFIRIRCDFSDAEAKVFTRDVFEAYQAFCLERRVQAMNEIGKFSTAFNGLIGSRAENKKVNIEGKSLQGYMGIKII